MQVQHPNNTFNRAVFVQSKIIYKQKLFSDQLWMCFPLYSAWSLYADCLCHITGLSFCNSFYSDTETQKRQKKMEKGISQRGSEKTFHKKKGYNKEKIIASESKTWPFWGDNKCSLLKMRHNSTQTDRKNPERYQQSLPWQKYTSIFLFKEKYRLTGMKKASGFCTSWKYPTRSYHPN